MAIQHSSSSLTWNCQENPPSHPLFLSPLTPFIFPVPPPFPTLAPSPCNAQQLLFPLLSPSFPSRHLLLTLLLLWKFLEVENGLFGSVLKVFYPSLSPVAIVLSASICGSVCFCFFISAVITCPLQLCFCYVNRLIWNTRLHNLNNLTEERCACLTS